MRNVGIYEEEQRRLPSVAGRAEGDGHVLAPRVLVVVARGGRRADTVPERDSRKPANAAAAGAAQADKHHRPRGLLNAAADASDVAHHKIKNDEVKAAGARVNRVVLLNSPLERLLALLDSVADADVAAVGAVERKDVRVKGLIHRITVEDTLEGSLKV